MMSQGQLIGTMDALRSFILTISCVFVIASANHGEELKQLRDEIEAQKRDNDELRVTQKKILKELEFLRDPPIFFQCAYNQVTEPLESTVTFESMLYSKTNQWTEGSGFDLESGVFTTPYPGTYSIHWTLLAADNAGVNRVGIKLHKNGAEVPGSYHESNFESDSGGFSRDQGGKYLVVHLERGDTIELYCIDCSSRIWYTVFCIQLA